eukprot:SM000125S26041  [mRNA]  locus=s125:84821:85778:+ [translate_table: standard]
MAETAKALEAQAESSMERARSWLQTHRLQAVGALWASGVAGSIAYNHFKRPNEKLSVQDHPRPVVQALVVTRQALASQLHSQFLTLAALGAAALLEYHDHHGGYKAKRYEQHIP